MKRFYRVMGALLVVLIMAASRADGQSVQVYGDTTLNSTYPATNFGRTANLLVSNTSQSLIEFPLNQLTSDATQITSATLIVYVNRLNRAGTLSVTGLSSGKDFGEQTVTSGTASTKNQELTSTSAINTAGQFYTVDVTSNVQLMVSGGFSYGQFLLSTTQGGVDLQLDSKENDATAHPPVLSVTLASQGAPGAAGPPGPTGANGSNGTNGANGTNGTNGSTPWTANILFPAGTGSGSNLYYDVPASSFGTAQLNTGGPASPAVQLQAPITCTAGHLLVNMQAKASGLTDLTVYSATSSSANEILGCSIPSGASACASDATATIPAGSLVSTFIQFPAGSVQFANTRAFISFVCQ